MKVWPRFALLAFAVCSLTAGCSREPVPVQVKGTVQLDGKPMPEGEVHFVTNGKPPEIIPVKDGTFEGKAMPGERQVQFAKYRPATIPPGVPKSMHALIAQGKENYLPAKYHRESKMTVEVKDSGVNEFSFEITSGSK